MPFRRANPFAGRIAASRPTALQRFTQFLP